ncbi:MAG: hypothetical protein ACK449_12005 [Planctomycetota bacterium]|jgi:hypothetical protein
MPKSTKVISFRLDHDTCKLLGALSERTNGSLSETARMLVIASLVGENVLLNEQLEGIRRSVQETKDRIAISDRRLAVALYHILEHVGKCEPDRAKKISQSILQVGEVATQ